MENQNKISIWRTNIQNVTYLFNQVADAIGTAFSVITITIATAGGATASIAGATLFPACLNDGGLDDLFWMESIALVTNDWNENKKIAREHWRWWSSWW
jgi:hypothetical protein